MSEIDIIELPGSAGKYARRFVVEAWIAAGSPPVNSATRLTGEQQYFYDGYRLGLPGFNPADNPNDPHAMLAHCRGVALDIDPTPERVRKLAAAGLVRPYSYEPWHWQAKYDVRRFGLVLSFPHSGGTIIVPPTKKKVDHDMYAIREAGKADSGVIIQPGVPPYSMIDQVFDAVASSYGIEVVELPHWKYDTAVREQWTAFNMSKYGGVELADASIREIADKLRDTVAVSMNTGKA